MSTAVNMFLKTVIREQGMPLKPARRQR
ncbi:hypothetical protein AB4920_04545 [Bifidobacterium dentium]